MAKIVFAPLVGVFVVWAPYPFTKAEADRACRYAACKFESMRVFECKSEEDAIFLQAALNS